MAQQLPSTSGTRDSRLWGLGTDGYYRPIALTADGKIPVETSVAAGPTTIADGADAAQGALADAKATDATSPWSVIALLKGIWDLLDTLSIGATTAATSTLSNVAENAASATLLAANAARLGGSIENDSDGILKLKAGTTASATSYTRTLLPREHRTFDELFGVNYTGRIDGIWLSTPATAGHDAARITEMT